MCTSGSLIARSSFSGFSGATSTSRSAPITRWREPDWSRIASAYSQSWGARAARAAAGGGGRGAGRGLRPRAVPSVAEQHAWQPEREGGDIGHQHQHDQHRDIEGQDAARYGFHGDLADGAADHQRRPDGRRQQPDAEIQDHDDAEMHRIDAEGLDYRKE